MTAKDAATEMETVVNLGELAAYGRPACIGIFDMLCYLLIRSYLDVVYSITILANVSVTFLFSMRGDTPYQARER